MLPQIKGKFTPRPKVGSSKIHKGVADSRRYSKHMPAVETEVATITQEIWAKLKTDLLKTTEEVCGTTKPHQQRRETSAQSLLATARASYNTAKGSSRCVVHHAPHKADKVVYEGIDHKLSDILRLTNQMRKAWRLAVMPSSTSLFHHQVSVHHHGALLMLWRQSSEE